MTRHLNLQDLPADQVRRLESVVPLQARRPQTETSPAAPGADTTGHAGTQSRGYGLGDEALFGPWGPWGAI